MRRRTKLLLSGIGLFGVFVVSAFEFGSVELARSGAIVQALSARTASLLVHCAEVSTAKLEFRKKGSSTATKQSIDAPYRRLLFDLHGLEPASEYEYEIVVQGATPRTLVGGFRTAPMPGSGSVRFAALGDSGKVPWWTKYQDRTPLVPRAWAESVLPGRGHQWEIASRIVEENVDLALHLGDIVYPEGAREHYNEGYFEPFAELIRRVPVWPTIGNHDVMTDFGKPVLEFFEIPGRYYDFVHGPVHFIAVDTYTSSLEADSEQRQWLLERLKQHRNVPWKVVFTHRPFWTVSRSKDDEGNALLRREIHPLLERHGVSLVLSGHDHNYQRFKPQGRVHYVIAGGGGKSLYELGTSPELVTSAMKYSFVVVDADTKKLKLRAIDEDGAEFDTLELVVPQ